MGDGMADTRAHGTIALINGQIVDPATDVPIAGGVLVRDGQIVEDSTLNAMKAQAPRQIIVTLHEQQSAAEIQWPSGVDVKYLPGAAEASSSVALMVPPSLRSRTCVLELLGTSVPFMQWAAGQGFADVVIGSPALEVLFRRYYEECPLTDVK